MYNGNSIVGGVAVGGGTLAATGMDSAWLVAIALALIATGFATARYAGRRAAA